MADLPSKVELEETLTAAAAAHDEYEHVVLKGVVDGQWSGFYAAYVVGHLGEFTAASRLALLFEEVTSNGDWSAAAADHVLMKLRS